MKPKASNFTSRIFVRRLLVETLLNHDAPSAIKLRLSWHQPAAAPSLLQPATVLVSTMSSSDEDDVNSIEEEPAPKPVKKRRKKKKKKVSLILCYVRNIDPPQHR